MNHQEPVRAGSKSTSGVVLSHSWIGRIMGSAAFWTERTVTHRGQWAQQQRAAEADGSHLLRVEELEAIVASQYSQHHAP
eukprot:2232277-Amphidinium_carterae.2